MRRHERSNTAHGTRQSTTRNNMPLRLDAIILMPLRCRFSRFYYADIASLRLRLRNCYQGQRLVTPRITHCRHVTINNTLFFFFFFYATLC